MHTLWLLIYFGIFRWVCRMGTPFSFSHIAQFSFIARENAIKIIHVDFLFPICILKHENYDLAWVIPWECCRCSQIHITIEERPCYDKLFRKVLEGWKCKKCILIHSLNSFVCRISTCYNTVEWTIIG